MLVLYIYLYKVKSAYTICIVRSTNIKLVETYLLEATFLNALKIIQPVRCAHSLSHKMTLSK